MNNKKKKLKELLNYEPPSIKEEVLAITILISIANLNPNIIKYSN
jgi:hypothetical protein